MTQLKTIKLEEVKDRSDLPVGRTVDCGGVLYLVQELGGDAHTGDWVLSGEEGDTFFIDYLVLNDNYPDEVIVKPIGIITQGEKGSHVN
jgi:hypothetical protein